MIIDWDNQVSQKIFVSLHLFSFSFGTNSTFTFALGSFLASYKYCLNEKTEKRKSLILIIEASFIFKVGGSSNYCVFFHTFRKVRILFIISTAAAKNLVFFHEMLLVVAEAFKICLHFSISIFFKVQIKFSFFYNFFQVE